MITEAQVDETNLEAVTQEIDGAALDVLGPLRMTKTLNDAAWAKLLSAVDRVAVMLKPEQVVPKKLVGTLWFIFTSMLTEADHSRDPRHREKIEMTAWDFAERLRRIFGPSF
jgi:hypothetical protein